MRLPPHFQQRQTFHDWLRTIYADQFTGQAVIHFAQGVANVIEIPGESQRILLDKPEKRAHA